MCFPLFGHSRAQCPFSRQMRQRVCETNSLMLSRPSVGVEIQSTERVPRCGVLKVGSATLREFTKGQKCQTLSSGEIEYYAAVTTTAEALHLQNLLEFLEMPGQAKIAHRLINGSTRHRPATGVRSSQAYRNKTLVASSGTRREKVDGGQGTDSNEHSRWIHESVADSEVSKYLEWRNRLSTGYDNGDDVETSKREALAESGRWARVEALHAIPRSVLVATLMQQTFVTRRRGWNDWNWLSKA